MRTPVTFTLPEGDPEIEAIKYLVAVLEGLSPEQQARVVRYLYLRYRAEEGL